MARTPHPEAMIIDADADPKAFAQASQTLNELAVYDAEQAEKVQALATQLQYDGSLTVGAVEDEIRFYMRRTVEDCLEVGKRLILLKELTPHGEFSGRIESLGLNQRTVQRFMLAASKTAKSDKLSLLSTRVKNVSAFLELVMHDDDELENLDDIDDIDCMSASELRQALRKKEADMEATDKVLASKAKEITKLQKELAKATPAHTDWPAQHELYIAQAQKAGRTIKAELGALDLIREQAMSLEADDGENETALNQAREMLASELVHIHNSCAEMLRAIGYSFDSTLGNFTDARIDLYALPSVVDTAE